MKKARAWVVTIFAIITIVGTLISFVIDTKELLNWFRPSSERKNENAQSKGQLSSPDAAKRMYFHDTLRILIHESSKPFGKNVAGLSEQAVLQNERNDNYIYWTNTFGNNKLTRAELFTESKDGTINIFGNVENDFDNSLPRYPYMLKVDSDGKKIWEKIIRTPGTYVQKTGTVTIDKGFTFVCDLNDNSYVYKINENGEIIASRKFIYKIKKIIESTNGGYFLTTSNDVREKNYLIKTDRQFNPVWEKSFFYDFNAEGGSREVNNMIETGNGEIIIVSTIDGSMGTKCYSGPELYCFDRTGVLAWRKELNLNECSKEFSIKEKNGGYCLVGATYRQRIYEAEGLLVANLDRKGEIINYEIVEVGRHTKQMVDFGMRTNLVIGSQKTDSVDNLRLIKLVNMNVVDEMVVKSEKIEEPVDIFISSSNYIFLLGNSISVNGGVNHPFNYRDIKISLIKLKI